MRFNPSSSLFCFPGNHNHTATQWIFAAVSVIDRNCNSSISSPQSFTISVFTEICFYIGCLGGTTHLNTETMLSVVVRFLPCSRNHLSPNVFRMNTWQSCWPICSHGFMESCTASAVPSAFTVLIVHEKVLGVQPSTPAMLSSPAL